MNEMIRYLYVIPQSGVGKRVRSTNLSHSRQWFNILIPRSDRIDYIVVCFTTDDCTRKLWTQYECELSMV